MNLSEAEGRYYKKKCFNYVMYLMQLNAKTVLMQSNALKSDDR